MSASMDSYNGNTFTSNDLLLGTMTVLSGVSPTDTLTAKNDRTGSPIKSSKDSSFDNHKASTANSFTSSNVASYAEKSPIHFSSRTLARGQTKVFNGTASNDTLIGRTRLKDAIFGYGGDDFIEGRGGGDFINGGDGNDTVSYKVGRFARIFANLKRGSVLVHAGTFHFYRETLVSIENIIGSRGNDRLIGNQEDNRLLGNSGNDYLDGGDGNDFLDGQGGNDVIVTGRGQDIVVLNPSNGFNIVKDFQDGEDKILLEGSIQFGQLSIRQQNNDVLIEFAGNKLMRLNNVDARTIDHTDFIL